MLARALRGVLCLQPGRQRGYSACGMCSMAMGTEPDLTGAGGVDDTDQRHLEDRGDSGSGECGYGSAHVPEHSSRVEPATVHSPPHTGAKPANSSRTSSSYWYTRAHRALRQRLSDPGQLLREYQHVLALDAAHAPHCRIAAGAAAAGRNRYCNVLPYDDNRRGFRACVLQCAV